MPEGQEVPKIENGIPNPSPEPVRQTEKSVSEYSFLEASARRKFLEKQKEKASSDDLVGIEARLAEIQKREDQLVSEVEEEGGFSAIDQNIELLNLMLKADQLSPSDIRDVLKDIRYLDDLAGLEKADPHTGIRAWYLEKGVDPIIVELRTKEQASVTPKSQQRETPSFEEGRSLLPPKERKNEQLTYVRILLDQIENSNRDCHDLSITNQVRFLETSFDRMDPEVREEVKARLAVHDSSELIKQAGGWISRDTEKVGYGYTIGSAATEANRRNHDLDRRTIDLLLKKGLPGLKISEAWDMIEEANFDYKKYIGLVNEESEISLRELLNGKLSQNRIDEIIASLKREIADPKEVKEEEFKGNFKKFLLNELKERNIKDIDAELLPNFFSVKVRGFELSDDEISAGKVPTNFYIDSEIDRKDAVRNYILHKLGNGLNAEKSFQLAEKLTIATLEISVFNRTSTFGNDQLAEIVGLKGWRAGRANTGRARGPLITEKLIDGFGTSWLRLQKEGGNPLVPVELVPVEQPVFAKDVDLQAIVEGNWVYYSTVIVTRYNLLKELLLNTAPKPGEVDKRFLQNAVVYFDTADRPQIKEVRTVAGIENRITKGGQKQLRLYWILGLLDMALGNRHLEWTDRDFALLITALTVDQLSEKAGSFLSPKQLQWAKDSLNYDGRAIRLTGLRQLETFIDGFFSPGSSGGAKRGPKK